MPFVELIIVLFVILAVITRFLTLYLLRKYRKLREDFDNARRCETGGSRCAASREQTACGTGSVSAVATSGSVCATGPAAPRRRNVVNSRGANLHSLAGLGF